VLHLGSIRTALFCWLYARHNSGQFVLRIEDTDRQRSTEQNVDAILDGLTWLGLNADEGPYFQTQRFERYRYDGRCRDRTEPRNNVDPVVRFKNPRDGEIVVNDLVRGTVVFENSQLDDLIIARSDRTPTYNFTVVVDDFDMDITHVIRGDDHLNNTPRQINMFHALGVEPPAFAHLPMILGPDGAKLSKRHGAVDIRDYRDLGYLPEAVLNYLVRLGWSFGDQEIFTLDEMIREFDITDVNQSASAFNPEKLLWTNQQHMIAASVERIGRELVVYLRQAGLDPDDGPDPVQVAEGYRERAETLVHMAASARYCYEDFDEIDSEAARRHLRPVILEPLKAVRENLSNLPVWDKQAFLWNQDG
jgi:glutamyl-tRNA synthetase